MPGTYPVPPGGGRGAGPATVPGDLLAELDRLLAPSVRSLRHSCAVDLTFGGSLAPGSRDAITIRHLDGHLGHTLRDLHVRAGYGLGGKVFSMGRPLVVRDYFNTAHIVHAYDRAVAPERIETVFAVPIRAGETVVGLLYLAQRDDVAIGDRIVARAVEHTRRIERDLAVGVEVRRRTAAYDEAATRDHRAVADARRDLDEAISLVGDPQARRRLREVSQRLHRITAGDDGAPQPAADGVLSARELDVLQLVATGAANGDIAAELGLRPNTVKAYLRSIARKLGATNRTHAVSLARESGLLP
ncbi:MULTISPECIES: LuxR C-terminal-related transcriptional regulator [Prauserella salsuginis group]|uniref:LuxR C-terminal-related transcriptional regulator n=1 Tax=Prauserella salsuginis TaxID=387889 RepID=A0ABW6GAW5_9PSEU|nr:MULTISPECIES: LuxR C-terminal-related transcriptional regulator [Prauserella salsuginis group]MCR3720620.1 regulatory protein, luxR family [Prauserella flava]MCR3735299.1 regulatory protein, luxR family [Prauserella salsuginis]